MVHDVVTQGFKKAVNLGPGWRVRLAALPQKCIIKVVSWVIYNYAFIILRERSTRRDVFARCSFYLVPAATFWWPEGRPRLMIKLLAIKLASAYIKVYAPCLILRLSSSSSLLSHCAARKWKIRKINGHVSKSDGCNFAPKHNGMSPREIAHWRPFFSNLCANDVDPRAFLLVHTIKLLRHHVWVNILLFFIQSVCFGKIAKNQNLTCC